MRSVLSLLCALLFAILFTPALVCAEDAPPPPPAPVGQTALTPSAPAAPQPPAPAPVAVVPVVARREETEVKIRSGFFSKLFPAKGAITVDQAADELSRLRAENDDLRTQLSAAQNELQAIASDWPAIREALLSGNAAAPVLQTPLGQQVTQATAAAAAQAANTGHDPKNLPGPGANKPAAEAPGQTDSKVEGHRAIAGHFQAQGWKQPGLN